MKWIGRYGLAACVALLACGTCGAAATEAERYKVHVDHETLMRGEHPLAIHAFEVPGLARPGTPYAELAESLRKIANVGGNAVCFNLYGFSEDGSSLGSDAVEAVRYTVSEAIWRRMGMVCRVLGAYHPEDEETRLAAVRTAAQTLEADNQLVYWIEGDADGNLAAEFKRHAPGLIVAASQAGDVRVVEQLPDGRSEGLEILQGSIPNRIDEGTHFILPGTDAMYAALDTAMADPIEKAPYMPDNTLLNEEEREQGWIALFDGKTLNGWTVTGENKEGFQVRDGAITWVDRGGGSVRTRDRYDNFILRLEWKIAEGGNSGVYLRAPRAARASKIGLEVQLRGDYGVAPSPDQTGAVYDVAAPRVNASRPAGEWNNMEVVLNGPRLTVVLNGDTIQDLNMDEHDELRYRLRRGFIGLQDHNSPVAFRNIRIKRL
jgi:hypothetical protein